MQIRTVSMTRMATVLLLAGGLGACTVDKQEAPALAGPSGLAQQVALSASPDRLAHNGAAQSVVTVTMTNESGQPVSGQRISVGASTGLISHVDVVTGSDGRASFVVTAPALSTPAESITVFATPFGTNADNALTRTAKIALTGPANTTAPTASFTFAPDTPKVGDTVAFDASASTDEGGPCEANCTYLWSYGEGSTGTGMVSTRIYSQAKSFVVTLTVIDNAGTVASTQQVVTVAP
jgi:hypothetical protein